MYSPIKSYRPFPSTTVMAIALGVSVTACDDSEFDDAEAEHAFQTSDEEDDEPDTVTSQHPVEQEPQATEPQLQLAAEQRAAMARAAVERGLEPLTQRVRLASAKDKAAGPVENSGRGNLSEAQLNKHRDDDPSWRSRKGGRFEAMLVLEDGTAFGQLGAAPDAPTVKGDDRAEGMSAWAPEMELGLLGVTEEDVLAGIEELEAEIEAADLEREARHAELGDNRRGVLGNQLSDDRRWRTTSTSTLQSFPFRVVGAINQSTSPGNTGCTATKIAPRVALTASHCVLDASGAWTTSGWFHPGQTRTTHPNLGQAVRWSGTFARDWRGGNSNRRWDYAVLFLEDDADVVSLGWVGVAYWTNASSYDGRTATVRGFPSRTGTNDTQRCDASPYTSKNCGGWMYSDSHALDDDAYRSDEQLGYNIDTGPAQSGSSVLSEVSGLGWTTLGAHWGCAGFGGCGSDQNRAARFRSSMWNDVCSWIGVAPSQHASHACQ